MPDFNKTCLYLYTVLTIKNKRGTCLLSIAKNDVPFANLHI